jgi:hypothetical protein
VIAGKADTPGDDSADGGPGRIAVVGAHDFAADVIVQFAGSKY